MGGRSDTVPSLAEYAAAESGAGRTQCKSCRLPAELLAQVNAAKDSGITGPTVMRWLEQQGYTISETSIRGHWRSHVKAPV